MDIFSLGVKVDTRDVTKAKREFDAMGRAGDKSKRSLDGIGEASTRGARGIGSMAGAARAASAAISALAFGQALRGIINITDEFTQLESRLRLVTESQEQLVQVQTELNNIAARTRGSVTGLTDLYIRLGQAGAELGANQQQLLQFTEGVSNALVLSGASAQSASGALIQLSQALGGGVVRAEEFNSILEGAPEIIRIVAREMDGMGGSISALRNAVNSGNVSSSDFFQAFLEGSQQTAEAAQQMERTVGNAAQGFRNTLNAAIAETDMSGLVDSIDDLSASLNDPAVRSGLESVASGIVNIANAATKAISWLGKLGTAIGETAGEFALQFDEMNALEKAFVAINPLARAYALQQAANTRNSKAAREEAEKGVRGVIDYVDGLTKLKGQTGLTGKAFFEFGKGVEQAAEATGKSAEQLKAEAEAAKAAAREIAKLAEAEAKRVADLQDQIAFQTRINELMRAGRTESEARFVAEFEAADALTQQLMIQQQVTEGLANAQDEAARAATATAEANKRAQEEAATAAQRAADETAAAAQRMRDELNRGITDGLLRGFEAGKGFVENFIDVLKAQFQSLVLRPTISFIVSGIQSAIGQIGGAAFSSLTGGSGIAGLLGGGAGGIGAAIFNGTLPLIDAIGNTFPTLASSLTNLSASLTALSPGMLALGAAGAAGLFAVGRGLAVDNSRVGENVQGAAAVLNPLSLVASGLDRITGGGAFGTKFRTVGQELTLSVEDGVIESMLWVTQSRKRSGYRGRKWRAWSEEFNTEIFQAAFDSLAGTAGQAARLAGTGLDLSATIQRDIFREENGAQLAFDDLATVIAERIVPGIRDFSREGETVANTFARITAQAQGLDAGLMGLNTSLSGVALFEQAERLSQVFGDQLPQALGSLQSVLLTSDQQFENLRTVLSGALGEVGVALTDSRENLLGVVQGLDLTTESGIRAYEVLLAAAPQLGQFFDTLEQRQAEAAQEAERLAEEQRRAAEAARLAAEEARQAELALAAARQQQRRGLLDQIAVLTSLDPEMTQLEQRFRDLRAEAGNDVGLIELVNRLSELEVGALLAARETERLNEETQKSAAIAQERAGLETQLLNLLGDTNELRRREREQLDPSNRALYDRINAVRDQQAADEAATIAAEAYARAQEQAAQELIRLTEGRMNDARRAVELAYGAEIAALQDLTQVQLRAGDARNDLTEAYNRESSALRDTISRIDGLRDSLSGLAQSAADARGRSLAQERAAFSGLSARAASGDLSAISALPDAGQRLMQLSLDRARTSDEYLADLVAIQRATADADSATIEQRDIAAEQLAKLDLSVAGLITVNESTLSVAQAVRALQTAEMADLQASQQAESAMRQIAELELARDNLLGIDNSVLSVRDAVLMLAATTASYNAEVLAGLNIGVQGSDFAPQINPAVPFSQPAANAPAVSQASSQQPDAQTREFQRAVTKHLQRIDTQLQQWNITGLPEERDVA